MTSEPLLRVMSLHALTYCERLFYLEEIEEIRVADAAVFDGRRVHVESEGEVQETFHVEAPVLGVKGRVDGVRTRDGSLVPVEIKKGRAAPGNGAERAWRTDRVQVGAYALMLEEVLGTSVAEARVRYLASNVSVRIPVDETLRNDVHQAIARARDLRRTIERPPVTENEKLCVRCSLAPVCLPDEARLAANPVVEPRRLFTPHLDGQVLHVDEPGARVGRRGESFLVEFPNGTKQSWPSHTMRGVVIHGAAQVSTQALGLCARQDVPVTWISGSGHVTGCFHAGSVPLQRHVRQFEALRSPELRLRLSKTLVQAKLSAQLRYSLRATRGGERDAEVRTAVDAMRAALGRADRAASTEALLGHEGAGAAAYFAVLRTLVRDDIDLTLRFSGRSRRPTRDRFNALLNFGYGMLYADCVAAVLAVGLHPAFGFYHQPRSAALPLALDLMEMFRVSIVDLAVIAAVNRATFHPAEDFQDAGAAVWLSASGRRKLIEVVERRRAEEWRHPVLGYSISYARMAELEVRLLEKEWTGEPGLFARARLR